MQAPPDIPQTANVYSYWVYSPQDDKTPSEHADGDSTESRFPFSGRRAGRDGGPRLRPGWELWTPKIGDDGHVRGPIYPPHSFTAAVRDSPLKLDIRHQSQPSDEDETSPIYYGEEYWKTLYTNASRSTLGDNWRGPEYAPRSSRSSHLEGFAPYESDTFPGVDPFHSRRVFEFMARSSVSRRLRDAVQDYLDAIDSRGTLDPHSALLEELCSTCAAVDWLSLFFAGWEGDHCGTTTLFANIRGSPRGRLQFQDMVKNTKCNFCRLIVGIVAQKDPDTMLLDFSEVKIRVTVSTSLQHLNIFGCYKLEVDVEKYFDPSSDEEYFLSKFDLVLRQDSCLPHRQFRSGRKLKPDADTSQIVGWWNKCSKKHLTCVKEQGGYMPNDPECKMEDRFVLRLIDVQENHVVVAPSDCKYVALSYVWGNAQVYRASKHNFSNWEEFSASERWPVSQDQCMELDVNKMPKTIQDALRITSLLGERYLWVDAVCIVQDDGHELAASIRNMHHVYREAALTIIAAGGADANASLPGLDSGTRDASQFADDILGLTVMLPRPSLVESLQSSVWGSRGWTYQERVLSRKVLAFTADQVYYQCPHDTVCEDRVETDRYCDAYPIEGDPYSRVLLQKRYHDVNTPLENLPWFDQYKRHIEEFSKRQLGSPSDALNACQAILNQYGPSNQYSWGIPLEKFEQALLWGCAEATVHTYLRGERRSDARPIVSIRRNPHGFPSWSWCGWIGAVEYGSFLELERVIEWPWYKASSQERDAAVTDIINNGGVLEFNTYSVMLDVATQRRKITTFCLNDGSTLDEGVREIIELSSERGGGSRIGRRVVGLFIHWEDGIARRDGWATLSDSDWYEAGPVQKSIRLG